MPTLEQVVKALGRFLEDGRVADSRWWAVTLARGMAFSDLERAIEEDQEILSLFENHFHLGNNHVRGMASDALKFVWDEIDSYLHPAKIAGLIVSESSDPDKIQEIIDRPEAREYLNRRVKEAYDYLYDLAWEEFEEE